VPASPSGKGFVEFFFNFYFKHVGAAVVGEMSDFGRAILWRKMLKS
jgi:hypothetical protein